MLLPRIAWKFSKIKRNRLLEGVEGVNECEPEGKGDSRGGGGHPETASERQVPPAEAVGQSGAEDRRDQPDDTHADAGRVFVHVYADVFEHAHGVK